MTREKELHGFELMEKNHKEAIATINMCLNDSSEPEMQAITSYLLETEANPYSFLPDGWGGSTSTYTGFQSLLRMIHHALYDDGDISFPIVNGEPRISFLNKHDEDYEEHVLNSTEKHFKQHHGNTYEVEQCKDVFDFIAKHSDYHRKDVRRFFILDAAIHGWEFAVEHHSRYANFDPDWEFDEEVVAEVEKKRELRKKMLGAMNGEK